MKVTKHVEKLLRQGQKPKELIELGFSKSVVTRVRRQLREEKATLQKKEPERASQGEIQLQTTPESPETLATIWQKVQSIADDLQRIDSLIQALCEASIIIAAARRLGTYRREDCPYQKDEICGLWTWGSQDEIPQGIGEPVQFGDESPEWHVKPSPLYCAMCTIPIEDRVDDVENKVSGDPLSTAKYEFTCSECGSKGWIAVKIMCTKCRRETYWGWVAKKE